MKKLIPALCMLLVAACLMGTSTYAWFSSNPNVTANGMSVKAAADGGIGIASWTNTDGKAVKPADTAFKTTASALWSNQVALTNPTIKPTSCNDGSFWTGTAATSDAETVAGEYLPLATPGTDSAINADYYNHTKWSIMSLNASANTTLKVASITVDVTGTSTAALNEALRIAIKTTTNGATTWNYFAPKSAASSFEVVTDKDTAGAQTVNTGNGAGVVLGTLVKTTPAEVEVFIYYDGEDKNCKTDNLATNVDTLSVTINYTNT